MCVGVPARILDIHGEDVLAVADIDVAGTRRSCCLAYVPEAQVGDWVLIQNGWAMSVLEESEALESLSTIEDYSVLDKLESSQPS